VERYLVYDARCGSCSRLAEALRDAVGDKLKAISIHDGEARALLDQARPGGWKYAPYLVTASSGKVTAETGISAALRLGWLIGPRKAWRVWSYAHRLGILGQLAVKTSSTYAAYDASRRQILKMGGSLALLLGLGVLGARAATPAFACGDCSYPRYWYSSCPCPDCSQPSEQNLADFYIVYDDCGFQCYVIRICNCGGCIV
jgi:predicted DCC family thiol-disulfide oxidoreductase YuxK